MSSDSTRNHKTKKAGKKGRIDRGGANLGRAMIKTQFPSAAMSTSQAVLETERGKHKLRSVTQCDDLEDLMANAMLAGTDFSSKRGEVVLVGSEANVRLERVRAPEGLTVPVPRRPAWRAGQAAEELDQNERAAFLEWRRSMAELEEHKGYLLTPFERNLEVWRQLWRVLERAQLVVQIVDARNPLLFRSEDLERYVAEIDPSKRCVLLVNKADLLSHAQRAAWARYFSAHSIEFVFWSAAAAQEAIEEEARRERGAWVAEMGGLGRGKRHAAAKQAAQQAAAKEEEQDDDEEGEDGEEVTPLPRAAAPEKAKEEEEEEDEEDEDDEDEDAMLMRLAGAQAGRSRAAPALPEMDDDDDDDESDDEEGDGSAAGADEDDGRALQAAVDAPPQKDATHVHTREELLALLLRMCPRQPRAGLSQGGLFAGCTIGLVGYPNVGKSSTVNVLAHEKKTSVSSTPGKTKHFQTLSVPDAPGLTLCDCPGLVFPTLAGSKAQMVCDGILPIDQLKSDYISPIRHLVGLLPPEAFEEAYAIKLRNDEERADDPDMPDLAHELLTAHALARGFMTATKGAPDESRSARVILKDLVNAKLLYAVPPPGSDVDATAAFAAGRKVPTVPTAARWLGQMKADYEAQEGINVGRNTGSSKRGATMPPGQAAARSMQWRPTGASALPDRLVAAGPKVVLE